MKPRSSSPAMPRHVRPPSAIDATGSAPLAPPGVVVVVVVVVVVAPIAATAAKTLVAAVSVPVHARVPVQRPLQPEKDDERPGTADSRTDVPGGKRAVHE